MFVPPPELNPGLPAVVGVARASELASSGNEMKHGLMPGVFYHPSDRRSFLRTVLWGGAAVLTCGTRGAGADSDGEGFRVALLSDTHVPADPQNAYRGFKPWDNLQAVVPEVLASRPEVAVINGDAARLEGFAEDYAALKTLLEPMAGRLPVVIGMGNHDDRANFFRAFPERPGVQAQVAGRHVTVLEHEMVRIVVLDSLLYVNQVAGLLGRDQRRWLAEYLPQVADRPLVLMVHHTLGDGDGDLLDVDRLFTLIAPHRHVKAIFYGHSHVWERQERRGVTLINLPAVGYNFRDQDPVGWVQARFHRQGVELKLRAIAGNQAADGEVVDVAWPV